MINPMNTNTEKEIPMSRTKSVQFSEEREQIVMDFLTQQGHIRIGDVIDMLGISPSTARLLLQKMQDKGMLKRTHGGAVPVDVDENIREAQNDFKNIENPEAKMKAARAAAASVEDGDYISIGSGTTTYLMATMLHGRKDLTVVTDSIPIAYELLEDDEITIYVCGGWIMKRNNACRGLTAENFFKDIRVDKAYNTADSIDAEFGTSSVDFDPRTESAICHSGKKCYIVADASKFSKRPYIDKVVRIDEIDAVFTDESIDPRHVEALEKAGIEVHIGR